MGMSTLSNAENICKSDGANRPLPKNIDEMKGEFTYFFTLFKSLNKFCSIIHNIEIEFRTPYLKCLTRRLKN